MSSESQAQRIVTFLNRLITIQPDVRDQLLDRGIIANEAVLELEEVNTRPKEDGRYITVTGIISAIGRLLDEEIASIYDDEEKLIGFDLRRNCGQMNQPTILTESRDL